MEKKAFIIISIKDKSKMVFQMEEEHKFLQTYQVNNLNLFFMRWKYQMENLKENKNKYSRTEPSSWETIKMKNGKV